MAALVAVSGVRGAPRGVVRRLARRASEDLEEDLAGMAERRRALEAAGVSLDCIRCREPRRRAATVDDILDATVAAWSAARISRGEARSFPDPPQVDASGRRMAIWA